MKRLALAALLLTLPVAAQAHDGWRYGPPPIAERYYGPPRGYYAPPPRYYAPPPPPVYYVPPPRYYIPPQAECRPTSGGVSCYPMYRGGSGWR